MKRIKIMGKDQALKMLHDGHVGMEIMSYCSQMGGGGDSS